MGGCGTYLSQVGSYKKCQDYSSTGYHRKTLFEVIVAGEEVKLKGEKLRCKQWMQLAEMSWSKHQTAIDTDWHFKGNKLVCL